MKKTLAVVFAGLLSIVTAAGAAAAQQPRAADGYYIAVLGNFDPGRTYTPDEMLKIGEDTLKLPQEASHGPSRITPLSGTPTPDGFKLWNPGTRTTSYIYNSDNWAANLSHCTTTCTVIDTWNFQIKEYVYGGTSTRWNITMNASRVRGSTPSSFSYEYYCGVDIHYGSDVLCAGGGADHSASGAFNPGDTINKSFGYSSSNRVIPMVRLTVLFSTPTGSVVVSAPFRGWDVCNNSSGTIKLCSSAKY